MNTANKKIIRALIVTFGIIVGLTSLVFAQDEQDKDKKKDQMQTLFSFDSRITGYGSLDTKFTRLNDKDAVIIGAHGGVIFNSYFYFGLGAYGLVTTNQFPSATLDESFDMHMGYTGLMMGFNIMPKKVVHFSVPLFIGVGNLELEQNDVFVENSAFLLFEPGLQLELNVFQFMKIGMGAGYRMVQGTNLRNDISDEELTYWSGRFSIVFGKF